MLVATVAIMQMAYCTATLVDIVRLDNRREQGSALELIHEVVLFIVHLLAPDLNDKQLELLP